MNEVGAPSPGAVRRRSIPPIIAITEGPQQMQSLGGGRRAIDGGPTDGGGATLSRGGGSCSSSSASLCGAAADQAVSSAGLRDRVFDSDEDSWKSRSLSGLLRAQPADAAMSGPTRSEELQISPRITKKLRSLRRAFAERTEAVRKATFAEPVTPPDSDDDASSLDSASVTILATAPATRNLSHRESAAQGDILKRARQLTCRSLLTGTINAHSLGYLAWSFVVVLAYIYNVFAIVLRAAFDIYYTERNANAWLTADYVCDTVYLLDLVLVKPRIQCISNGLTETDIKKTARKYLSKTEFKLDLLSLLPLDVLYLAAGVRGRGQALLRLPRFFKLNTFWEFFDRVDQLAESGYVVRVTRSMIYLIYLVHIEACGYYAVSNYEGIGSTSWTYSGKNTAYIQCFYLAAKTATSIGNNPKPTNILEFLFMTTYWLLGIFVFAILVGQVRSVLESANALEVDYQLVRDRTMAHLRSLNVPKNLRDKVRTWFEYNWDQQRALDENQLIEVLPRKLKTDLLIDVHFETLSKVNLFQDCEKDLLLDLILKLVPTLYLPGDYICKKGEVGTEMYIIAVGTVEVVGDDGTILATLSKGSVFGEISLLALSGQNRRTAHVKSKGFSNLFVLHKKDFETAMEDYPKAHELLKRRARKIIRKNEKHAVTSKQAEEIIKTSRDRTPKLLHTVVEVVSATRRDSLIPTWLNCERQARPATAMDMSAGSRVAKNYANPVFTISGETDEQDSTLQPRNRSQLTVRPKSAFAGY